MKFIFVFGDFNADLFKEHEMTTDLIDVTYSIYLFPIIVKPTRITSNSATIIDNILTNEIGNKIVSGLLINDISEYLPVYTP